MTAAVRMLPLDMLSGDLLPTLTYDRRAWTWVPADPTDPGWDGRAGNLTIVLEPACRNGRRRATRVEADTYAVAEDAPGVYGLVNLTDAAQEDAYEATLHPTDPDRDTCTCPAGRCRRACKHTHAVRAVRAAGGFDRD